MHASLFVLPFEDPVLVVLVLVSVVFLVPYACRKLGFPEIVALIGAGIVLGPHVLGVLAQDRVIEMFGTVGILMLMFIAGLEIDANDFRRYRKRSFLFGFLTFAIPMAIGTAAALWMLRMDLLPAILLASMFASHTLLSYPIAGRLRITGDEAVGVAVGGTIITDVAALMVLAVVVAAHGGRLDASMALRMGLSLAGLVVFALGVLPPLSAWVYDRLDAAGDLQFLFTLVVLFACAVLAELAGVEPIVGAFLAGIAVGRHIPPVSPLANRVEFFGNAVFVPTFLISVGMRVDPRAFVSDPASLAVSAVMTACVLSGKWLAAFLLQKAAGWSRARRAVVFGLSVAQAAATLAAVLVGYRVGLFPDAVLNGTIVMILVSVVVSAAAVQAGGAVLARESAEASTAAGPGRRVLLGVADPAAAERLLDLALMAGGEAKALRAVAVVPPGAAGASAEAAKRLKPLEERAAAAGAALEALPRVDDSVPRGLAHAAREFPATDIVIGWREPASFFDRNTREILEALEGAAPERLLALRARSPLGTKTSVVFLAPRGAAADGDFGASAAVVKEVARKVQAKLTCRGPRAELDRLRAVMEAGPPLGGVSYEESDPPSAAAKPGPREARADGRILLAAFVPRRNSPSWTEDAGGLLAAADGRLRGRDLLVVMPRATAAAEPGSAPKGLAGWLARRVARTFDRIGRSARGT